MITILLTVIGYLPWLFTFIKTFNNNSTTFWIQTLPSIGQCINYVFESAYSRLLFVLFCVSIIIYVMYKTKILNKNKENNKWIEIKNYNSDINVIWMIIGISSVIGTVLVAFIVSKIYSPLFQLKYMYPVTIVAWLIFSIVISEFKNKKICYIIIITIILLGTIPYYIKTYIKDKEITEIFHSTMKNTEEINENDIILTDIADMYWNTSKYYYPKSKCLFLKKDKVDLNEEYNYYLIIKEKLNDNYTTKFKNDYKYKTIIENGNIGTINVNIYKIEK